MTITFSGRGFPSEKIKFHSRIAYAAAPVTADQHAENIPGAPAVLDWAATLRFRHHLWSLGFGVAEAMDTAQRGAGLDYPATRELIRRSAAEARSVGGAIVAGVGPHQLPPRPPPIDDIRKADAEQ
ncbi:dihydrodipicolinate synthase family protein, partial [Actinoplanes sp. KI2]|uniref:dihydrodipicolinate synthase family protein n=1 Tax=Actinoplanes sp. KI2 TaxID=2983315 RepID=UPI0021D6026F